VSWWASHQLTLAVNRSSCTRYWLWLLACFYFCTSAQAVDDSSVSHLKLQRLMEQSRASKAATLPAANTPSGALDAGQSKQILPAPGKMQERAQLLERGEAALVRNDTDTAQSAFEAAAVILHAADTEMGIVRTYMQQGQYRRALAFAAHTAGSHPDDARGSALYAWLLHLGGQPVIAQKLLLESAARVPGKPLLSEVQKQLQTKAPRAIGDLLNTPARMAPQGPVTFLPKRARVIASGLLIDNGKLALVPAAALGRRSQVWVRNGLGQLAKAQLERKRSDKTMAVLTLRTKLAEPDALMLAPIDAFPGSAVFALEYNPSAQADAQWPVLHMGFLGSVGADSTARPLGITLDPGPRGGPVFDDGGRLIGIAVVAQRNPANPDNPGDANQIFLTSALHQRLGAALGHVAAAQKQRMAVDRIYESALRSTLQIIAVP
jgi:hypothetical protein